MSLTAGLLLLCWATDRPLRRLMMARLATLTVGGQALAFLSPTLAIYNLAAGVAVPLVASQRRLIAPVYIYLLLTLPLVATTVSVAGVYLTAFDVSITLGLGASAALMVRSGPAGPSRSFAWDLPAIALFLLFVLAYSRSSTATNLLRVVVEQFCTILLPYLVVSRAVRTREDLRLVLYALVAATAALCALALYEAVHAWPLYRSVWNHYGIPLTSGASVKLRAGLLRSPGPFPEPTSFAYVLTLGMMAALAGRSLFRSPHHRRVILLFLFAGLCAPQSRGGWLGLIAGSCALLLFERRYKLLSQQFAGATVLGVGALAAAAASSRIAGFLGIDAEGTGTLDYRSSLLTRGLEQVREHPLTGTTISEILYNLRDLRQGEGIIDFVNAFLFIAMISGIVGLVVFVASLLWPVLRMWFVRARIAGDRWTGEMAGQVSSGIIAAAVMLGFTSIGGRSTNLLVILLALAGSVLAIARQSRVRAQRAENRIDADAPAVAIPA